MAFNLPKAKDSLMAVAAEADSLSNDFSSMIKDAQTLERDTPSAKFSMQHNLYNLLGDVVMGSMKGGRFDQPGAEGYVKDLFDLQLLIDFQSKYGVQLGTGPSSISPGTRDFNLKFTKEF